MISSMAEVYATILREGTLPKPDWLLGLDFAAVDEQLAPRHEAARGGG